MCCAGAIGCCCGRCGSISTCAFAAAAAGAPPGSLEETARGAGVHSKPSGLSAGGRAGRRAVVIHSGGGVALSDTMGLPKPNAAGICAGPSRSPSAGLACGGCRCSLGAAPAAEACTRAGLGDASDSLSAIRSPARSADAVSRRAYARTAVRLRVALKRHCNVLRCACFHCRRRWRTADHSDTDHPCSILHCGLRRIYSTLRTEGRVPALQKGKGGRPRQASLQPCCC